MRLWPSRATVGGILSTNDSGALRLRFGSLRDLVIGITLALPDGTLAKSGGKVVKNVAGYDLPKLVTGAFGTLGVITQATFRLASDAEGIAHRFVPGSRCTRRATSCPRDSRLQARAFGPASSVRRIDAAANRCFVRSHGSRLHRADRAIEKRFSPQRT